MDFVSETKGGLLLQARIHLEFYFRFAKEGLNCLFLYIFSKKREILLIIVDKMYFNFDLRFFPQVLQNICYWWLSNLIIDELERNDYMYMCTHRH